MSVDRNKGYLPGRLRIAAGTVNFNDSRVLAKCLTDAADEIERLIQRVRELEAATLYLWKSWASAEGEGQPELWVFGHEDDPTGAPADVQAALRLLLTKDAK